MVKSERSTKLKRSEPSILTERETRELRQMWSAGVPACVVIERAEAAIARAEQRPKLRLIRGGKGDA